MASKLTIAVSRATLPCHHCGAALPIRTVLADARLHPGRRVNFCMDDLAIALGTVLAVHSSESDSELGRLAIEAVLGSPLAALAAAARHAAECGETLP